MENAALSGGQMACSMLFGTAIITYLGLEISRLRVLMRVSQVYECLPFPPSPPCCRRSSPIISVTLPSIGARNILYRRPEELTSDFNPNI